MKSNSDGMENLSNLGNIVSQSNASLASNFDKKYRKPKTIDPFAKIHGNNTSHSGFISNGFPIREKEREKDRDTFVLNSSRNPVTIQNMTNADGQEVKMTNLDTSNNYYGGNSGEDPKNKKRSQVILNRLQNLLGGLEDENSVKEELIKDHLMEGSRIREESEEENSGKLTASRESLFKPLTGTRTFSNRYILPHDEQ